MNVLHNRLVLASLNNTPLLTGTVITVIIQYQLSFSGSVYPTEPTRVRSQCITHTVLRVLSTRDMTNTKTKPTTLCWTSGHRRVSQGQYTLAQLTEMTWLCHIQQPPVSVTHVLSSATLDLH